MLWRNVIPKETRAELFSVMNQLLISVSRHLTADGDVGRYNTSRCYYLIDVPYQISQFPHGMCCAHGSANPDHIFCLTRWPLSPWCSQFATLDRSCVEGRCICRHLQDNYSTKLPLAGYDCEGAKDLRNLVDTNKWIGAAGTTKKLLLRVPIDSQARFQNSIPHSHFVESRTSFPLCKMTCWVFIQLAARRFWSFKKRERWLSVLHWRVLDLSHCQGFKLW